MLTDRPIDAERLVLRTLDRNDVTEEYLSWLHDPEITRYLEIRFAEQTREGAQAFVAATNASDDSLFLGIFLKDGGDHIGNIKLGPIDWNHRHGDIGIIIGSRPHWGRGYAAEAIAGVTTYAFNVLNLHKILAGLYAANEGSRRAFLKAGWFEEGRRPSHWLCQGEWQDDIKLGILNGNDR